jgi:hypothetical protein
LIYTKIYTYAVPDKKLHRESVLRKELDILWKKHTALDPNALACYLLGKPVINYVKKELRAKYKSTFNEAEIADAIKKVIAHPICIDNIKPAKDRKKKEKFPLNETKELVTSELLPETAEITKIEI